MDDLQYAGASTSSEVYPLVLNLVINGWPSILFLAFGITLGFFGVLNLVINGWPSIQCKYL